MGLAIPIIMANQMETEDIYGGEYNLLLKENMHGQYHAMFLLPASYPGS